MICCFSGREGGLCVVYGIPFGVSICGCSAMVNGVEDADPLLGIIFVFVLGELVLKWLRRIYQAVRFYWSHPLMIDDTLWKSCERIESKMF